MAQPSPRRFLAHHRLAAAAAGATGIGALLAVALLLRPADHAAVEVEVAAPTDVIDFAEDPCGGYPYLKFDSVLHNNLGGKGPDGGEEVIRYLTKDVSNGDHLVEVTMEALSDYKPHAPKANGINGYYGIFNVEVNSKVRVKTTLRDHETKEPYTLKELAFTFFDMDTGKHHKSVESVNVGGFSKRILTKTTEVSETKEDDGSTTFRGTTWGTGGDNPTDPRFLTKQQKDRAITLLFEDVDHIEFEVGATRGVVARFFTWVARPSLLCAVTVQAAPPAPKKKDEGKEKENEKEKEKEEEEEKEKEAAAAADAAADADAAEAADALAAAAASGDRSAFEKALKDAGKNAPSGDELDKMKKDLADSEKGGVDEALASGDPEALKKALDNGAGDGLSADELADLKEKLADMEKKKKLEGLSGPPTILEGDVEDWDEDEGAGHIVAPEVGKDVKIAARDEDVWNKTKLSKGKHVFFTLGEDNTPVWDKLPGSSEGGKEGEEGEEGGAGGAGAGGAGKEGGSADKGSDGESGWRAYGISGTREGAKEAQEQSSCAWWLWLLLVLLLLLCCLLLLLCCGKKKGEEESYAPLLVEPQEAVEEEEPDGVRIDMEKDGVVKTEYLEYKPLGCNYKTGSVPPTIDSFKYNSYLQGEKGAEEGHKIVRIGKQELKDSDHGTAVRTIDNEIAGLPQYPLPLHFDRNNGTPEHKTWVKTQPLGMKISPQAPYNVQVVEQGRAADRQGIKEGWTLTKVANIPVGNKTFAETMKHLREGMHPLPKDDGYELELKDEGA